jgi:hypothetical protein
MLEEEEEEMPPGRGEELTKLDEETLKELLTFAKGGMAKDIGSRLAPPPAPPAEDPEIPGVDAVPEEEESGPDVEKLKALLASMGG